MWKVRKLLAWAFYLWAAIGSVRADPLSIKGPARAEPFRLVELVADGDVKGAALVWDVTPDDQADVRELPGGRLLFVGPPGTYKVKLRAIRVVDGVTSAETARAVVVIGTPTPPPPVTPPVPPAPKGAGVAAIAKLRVGNSGCTCAAIYPRRPDGKWDVLTASHCTGGVGSTGVMTLKDGRSFNLTVTARDRGPDLTWFVTDSASAEDMPYLVLAKSAPAPGTAVWHAGYGVDRPTNREEGTVSGGPDSNGQLGFRLSVSSGDSGGPILRVDNDEVVSSVCCTQGLGALAPMYGGSCTVAWKMRPGTADITLPEVERHPGCVHPIELLK